MCGGGDGGDGGGGSDGSDMGDPGGSSVGSTGTGPSGAADGSDNDASGASGPGAGAQSDAQSAENESQGGPSSPAGGAAFAKDFVKGFSVLGTVNPALGIVTGLANALSQAGVNSVGNGVGDTAPGPGGGGGNQIRPAGVQRTQAPRKAVSAPTVAVEPEVELDTAGAAARAAVAERKKSNQRMSINSLRSNQGIGFFSTANTYRPQLGI